MTGSAVVIGASGGIGAALTSQLVRSRRYGRVLALSRQGVRCEGATSGHIDLTEEASIIRAAEGAGQEIECLMVATGMLHTSTQMPERALRELSADRLAANFAVNTIGPALILKHFVPLLARDRRAVIGIVSARVGSISDNRLGGWYGYRASKAALNMIVKCAAIELERSRPKAICVGLHPGTVDTALSLPFQKGVPSAQLFTAEQSATYLLHTLDALETGASGHCYAWDGTLIEP